MDDEDGVVSGEMIVHCTYELWRWEDICHYYYLAEPCEVKGSSFILVVKYCPHEHTQLGRTGELRIGDGT